MLRIYLFALLLLGVGRAALRAQQVVPLPLQPDPGCELPLGHSEIIHYRPYVFKERPRPKAMTFTFDYWEDGRKMFGDTCVTWPAEAKAAFEYATAVWGDVLENDIPVDIAACYSPTMAAGTLGSATPQLVALYDFMGDTTIMPQALAENIFGADFGGSDVYVIMNRNFDFYFGTDANPPAGQVDFVTLSIHELGHGLGFVGAAAVDDGDATNGVECANEAGTACVGYYGDYFDTGVPRAYASVYDRFADRAADGVRLLDLPNPGPEIRSALVGGGGGVLFDGGNQLEYYPATDAYPLYTPSVFTPGSTYSHFADNAEVLYFQLSYGTAIHDVGAAREVMHNIGWPEAVTPPAALPVTWQSFTAEYDGAGAWLLWSTSSETDNAGFYVEVSRNGGPFVTLGEVPPTGDAAAGGRYRYYDPRPAPGLHHYRIRQDDFGGRSSYSYLVGVRVDVVQTVLGHPYPNPAYGSTLRLPVRSAAPGQLSLHAIDATGRTLARRTLDVRAGEQILPLELAGLPRGLLTLVMEMHGERYFRRVVVR